MKLDKKETKRIIRILKYIRRRLKARIKYDHKLDYAYSLCNIAKAGPSLFDAAMFIEYLGSLHKRKHTFYNHSGRAIKIGNPGNATHQMYYFWKPDNYQVRLKWLDKRIKIEEERLKKLT